MPHLINKDSYELEEGVTEAELPEMALSFKGQLEIDTDLDNVTDLGFYMCSTSHLHAPDVDYTNEILVVLYGKSGTVRTITQVLLCPNNSNAVIAVRSNSGLDGLPGAWTPWRLVERLT